MAFKKVKTFKIDKSNETGETYKASLAMQICTDTGRFRIEVPEDLSKLVKASGAEMYHPKGNEKYIYAYGNSLKDVEKIIHKAVDEFLKCKIEVEIVIVYRWWNRTKFYRTHEGEIQINGTNDDNYHDQGKKGKWCGGEGVGSFDEVKGMGLNIFLQVLEQKRFIRPNSTSATYSNYCHRSTVDEEGCLEKHSTISGDYWHNSDIAEKLSNVQMNGNAIRHLNSYHETDINNDTGDYKIIKFTEENGQFFLNMCFGMFKLADKFNDFFLKDSKEIEAIKPSVKLLE